MNISSSIKIVPKVFGNKILWYYITMKEEGDLALEKLEQDPSLNIFFVHVIMIRKVFIYWIFIH